MSDLQQAMPATRRALVALAIRVASAGIAYVTQILLARWLGLEQYGMFAAVWAWLLIAGGTLPLGLNVTVIGRLPHYLAGGEIARWRGLALGSMAVTFALSCLVAAAGIALLVWVPALAGHPLAALAVLGMICLPLLALAEINEGIARAHGWIGSALLPAYVARPLIMLGLGAIVLMNGGHLDVASVLKCAILACLVTSLAQTAWLMVCMHRMNPEKGFSISLLVWLGMSLPMLVTEICDMLLASLDLFFVAALLGSEEAGVYFAAQRTIALVAFVNFAVGAATANAVAAEARGARGPGLQREIRLAATLAFWPSLAGAALLVAASPLLLALFGAQFTQGTQVVALLAIGFVARSIVGPADLLFNVLGAQRACAWILAAHLVLSLILNALLVPALGIAGAALAATFGMVSLSLSFMLYARLRLGLLMTPGSPMLIVSEFGHGLARTASRA